MLVLKSVKGTTHSLFIQLEWLNRVNLMVRHHSDFFNQTGLLTIREGDELLDVPFQGHKEEHVEVFMVFGSNLMNRNVCEPMDRIESR